MSTNLESIRIWDERYAARLRVASENYEPWLKPWESLLRLRQGRALDLGCGPGFDTEQLHGLGFKVTALDQSPEAVALSKERTPLADHLVADIRDLKQLETTRYSVILASLSLHYFDRADTEAAFSTIIRLLMPDGLLLFRVNAEDEHGAPQDPDSWELTSVEGIPKQFFTPAKILGLLAGEYTVVSLKKLSTNRFGRNKSLYEVVAVKNPPRSSAALSK